MGYISGVMSTSHLNKFWNQSVFFTRGFRSNVLKPDMPVRPGSGAFRGPVRGIHLRREREGFGRKERGKDVSENFFEERKEMKRRENDVFFLLN
ncbi:hypothetical protein QVD17_39181 [Tagetes erecta]|uniref:Uncharacterized protein n=1 Tax=Tagetes erecta TaxID=13708 RepID=A0AAD8JRU4_TARER|nr:hypothetical protein QVD17_39181 [Tagetes erecta]